MEELHIQPSEIDNLPFFEYEYTIQLYQEMLEERKANSEKESNSSNDSAQLKNYTSKMDSYQRNAMKYVKRPSMPNVSIPKMPKL